MCNYFICGYLLPPVIAPTGSGYPSGTLGAAIATAQYATSTPNAAYPRGSGMTRTLRQQDNSPDDEKGGTRGKQERSNGKPGLKGRNARVGLRLPVSKASHFPGG